MQKFWMVLGCGTPTYRHDTLQSACLEAERLARLTGDKFVVLEAVAEVVRSDVQWRKCQSEPEADEEIGIPF